MTDKDLIDLREALIKDFNRLYRKEYVANWQSKRIIRNAEISIMDFKNTMKLIRGK